jgi:Arc/MetJ family transcription regulator
MTLPVGSSFLTHTQKYSIFCVKEITMSRTNIDLDDRLIREGLKRTGIKTKRELVHKALENYIRKQKLKEILKLRGKVKWEGDLKKMRRGRVWSS